MTEYTPTTDDVREAYRGIILATEKPEVFELIDPEQADAEFDRWLAEVKAQSKTEFVDILMRTHSHDPGLCGDVADFTNNAVLSDECLFLQRIYSELNRQGETE